MSASLRTTPPDAVSLPTAGADRASRADWDKYASAYDLLLEHNPAYRDLRTELARFLGTIEAPERIYDIGGGTGNFTEIAAAAFPTSEILLAEPNPSMIAL